MLCGDGLPSVARSAYFDFDRGSGPCPVWVILWGGLVGQCQNLTVDASEEEIVQRIQFLLRRLLDFERVFSHASGYASGGLPGIARRECPVACGGIPKSARPKIF